MSTNPIVFIVDDDRSSRESARALVATLGLPTRAFASAEEFLNAYQGEPGCLITDLRMPGMSGVELLDAMADRGRTIPVVVVSGYAEVPVTVELMLRGAVTVLEKPCRNNDLWKAVRTAVQLDAESRLISDARREIKDRIDRLTDEERCVMRLIVDGQANKTIATRLDLSLRTVEARRRTVLARMQVESVARLVQDVMFANDCQRLPSPLASSASS
jgi:FixJ family two-component response regulator